MTPLHALQRAHRPLLIYGWGIHLARAESEAIKVAMRLGMPYATTWGAADLDSPLCIGNFGTHGMKHVNWAIWEADWIMAVGTRLDTKAVGKCNQWTKAEVWMVDIDQAELDKYPHFIGIRQEAKEFLSHQLALIDVVEANNGFFPNFTEWRKTIDSAKDRYPAIPTKGNSVEAYRIIERLSDALLPDDIIVSDTGCALAWFMQAFRFSGQRFFHAFNNTPMGSGLPMAIGAAFASGRRVILITGDGGLGVSIGELAVVARHNLPIKILLFNNKGHAMCRQTQREWLDGRYPATSFAGGLATPNFRAIAQAFWIENPNTVEKALALEGAAFFEFAVDPNAEVIPKAIYDVPNFQEEECTL